MENIETIIQGGAVGIAVMLIALIGFIFKRLMKFMSNHVNHNTKALTELVTTIRDLKEYLKNGK